jgi:NADH-quinone oxidoreductase subunit L
VTAALTAFYMFRLLFLTFTGELRASHEVAHHVHESPATMTIPLVVLAALSLVGGWVGLPEGWLWGPAFDRFLAPVTGHPHVAEHAAGVETALMLITTILAAAGATLAYVFYVRLPGLPMILAWRLARLRSLSGKYWIDEPYDATVVRPLRLGVEPAVARRSGGDRRRVNSHITIIAPGGLALGRKCAGTVRQPPR